MERRDVYVLCKEIAPRYEFDPILILAICKQESDYDSHARRLEQGFFWRYTRNDKKFNDVDEVLLAASWGLMQMMGLSLFEAKHLGYDKPIYEGLVNYLDFPAMQIDTGCLWLSKKREKAGGDLVKTLSYWNGDMTGKYAKEVIDKYESMRHIIPIIAGEIKI